MTEFKYKVSFPPLPMDIGQLEIIIHWLHNDIGKDEYEWPYPPDKINNYVYFRKEEDAIMFKLKFGS